MNLAQTHETAWLWLRDKLVAAGVTGGRVYRELAPSGATYPLTIVSLIPLYSVRGNGPTHVFDATLARLLVHSRNAPPSSTATDRAAAYTALDAQAGSVAATGGTVLSCVKVSDLPALPRNDGTDIYWQPGLEFKLEVQ